jgi:glc operon protein GlcG
MIRKTVLALEDARRIAAAAVAEAGRNRWTMAVALVDDGGHLICFDRIDGTQVGSVEVAIGKARTAVFFKRPTKALEDAVAKGKFGFMNFPHAIPMEGGVPIYSDGNVIGGIGVSGATSSEDAQVAEAGINALK